MSIRQDVIAVLAKHAQCDAAKIAPENSLADIGINSLKFIVVLLEIEKVTGRKMMEMDKIGKLKTVGDVFALAERT